MPAWTRTFFHISGKDSGVRAIPGEAVGLASSAVFFFTPSGGAANRWVRLAGRTKATEDAVGAAPGLEAGRGSGAGCWCRRCTWS